MSKKSEKNNGALPMIVPIFLPLGQDAHLVGEVVEQHGAAPFLCRSVDELFDRIHAQCGPFVVDAEALSGDALARLAQILDELPPWSDLPGIIPAKGALLPKLLDLFATHWHIITVQKPLKKNLFANMLKAALEARRRQFQIRDLLTDLTRTNQQLLSRTSQLQKLTLQLTRAEEQERKRIARILHDDLQQMLASARLHTELLFDDASGHVVPKVQAVYDIVSQSMKAARSLSHGLSPVGFKKADFVKGLKQLVSRMAENFKFKAQTNFDSDCERIGENSQMFIYRSVQELIFNCAKHARASQVALDVSRLDQELIFTVTDNGVGFEPGKLADRDDHQGGLGLFSIQERAEALGGFLKINSSPGKGSRFILKIPLEVENDTDKA
jgi:signal transduction histidine kinase